MNKKVEISVGKGVKVVPNGDDLFFMGSHVLSPTGWAG